jgi:hypothetical protein
VTRSDLLLLVAAIASRQTNSLVKPLRLAGTRTVHSFGRWQSSAGFPHTFDRMEPAAAVVVVHDACGGRATCIRESKPRDAMAAELHVSEGSQHFAGHLLAVVMIKFHELCLSPLPTVTGTPATIKSNQ